MWWRSRFLFLIDMQVSQLRFWQRLCFFIDLTKHTDQISIGNAGTLHIDSYCSISRFTLLFHCPNIFYPHLYRNVYFYIFILYIYTHIWKYVYTSHTYIFWTLYTFLLIYSSEHTLMMHHLTSYRFIVNLEAKYS